MVAAAATAVAAAAWRNRDELPGNASRHKPGQAPHDPDDEHQANRQIEWRAKTASDNVGAKTATSTIATTKPASHHSRVPAGRGVSTRPMIATIKKDAAFTDVAMRGRQLHRAGAAGIGPQRGKQMPRAIDGKIVAGCAGNCRFPGELAQQRGIVRPC